LSYFGDRSQILTRHAKFGKQHIFLLLLNYSVTSPFAPPTNSIWDGPPAVKINLHCPLADGIISI